MIKLYSEIFIFSLLIRGAINAVWGDVLGGSGGGFGRCGGMFWEVWGRFLDVKNVEKTYKITLLISISIFAVLNFYFFIVPIPGPHGLPRNSLRSH